MTANRHLKHLCLGLLGALGVFLLTAPAADALCIKEKRANLRKGPDLKYEKLWEVFKYMPFSVVGKKGAWLRVKDLDGDTYWVHSKLTTKKYKCAVIKQDRTNLREGPGTKYPLVSWSPVDKYFSLKVLKIKNDWVSVVDAVGDKAWVYKPLVWIR